MSTGSTSHRQPQGDRPNFLIVMSDEHGAKFSGTYGHPYVETPAMDRIAEMGVTVNDLDIHPPTLEALYAHFRDREVLS